MKTTLTLLTAVLLGFAGAASAQTTSGMQGMQMGHGMHTMQKGEVAEGTGVIRAIDAAEGTVTIQHQAIASIHWPAMTMTFKADPSSLLKGIKVGEKVTFTLHPDGMHSRVTAITPAQ